MPVVPRGYLWEKGWRPKTLSFPYHEVCIDEHEDVSLLRLSV